MKPLFAIITVVKDNVDGLQRTADSVFKQDFTNYEYLVVDGKSTDGSLALAETWQNEGKAILIEDVDSGISDAFNKAIIASSADFLLFLNSGDVFNHSQVLSSIAPCLQPDKCLTCQVYFNGKVFPRFDHTAYSQKLWKRAMIHHQASFIPRAWFDRYGLYDPRYRIRMDYEFWLRVLKNEALVPVPSAIVDFDAGISMKNIRVYYDEEKKANRRHLGLWAFPLNIGATIRFYARATLRFMGFSV